MGLGYLTVGQASATLSGGKARHIKLGTELTSVIDAAFGSGLTRSWFDAREQEGCVAGNADVECMSTGRP